jgi:DNA-binding LacI/PurR family transcriptional regulator
VLSVSRIRSITCAGVSGHPTALTAITDLVAVGIINQAEVFRLTVGHNLPVIGFDDSPLGQYPHPPLTTLHQPTVEIGQELIRSSILA